MDPYHAPMARISLGSLAPPDVDAGAGADPPPPQSCLLDSKPFFGKMINDTTATFNIIHPDDEQRPIVIQATLFVARAPGVSYVLAWATGTRFTEEPHVLSTHGGFVLLSMAVRLKKWPFSEYYIYHPGRDHGGDGHPELCRIEQPNSVRLIDECCAVGLISHGGGYSVAALAMQEKGEFQLYIFSSETRAWTIKKPVLSLADGATDLGDYMPDKAIAVGGGGAMAFVDLWNGILFCNVLDSGEHPELCYLRLPSAELCRPHTNRLQPRDIAFDMSSDTICIRFVEVVCPSFSAGWHASTWTTTTMAMSPWRQQKKGWQQVTKLYDHELLVADGVSTDGLLPEVSELADTAFGNLLVDMPMLSLHENNIICFLAKHHIADSEVWAIAVDMETKKLKGVNLLQVGRCTRLFYSTISSHLNMTAAPSGERECPKRPGTQLESYPHKKQQQQLSMVSSAVGEQEQEAMGALDGDEDNV